LQADLDRFRDLALRSQADFENYKKRAAREKEDAIKYANSGLLDRLLPIIDNFELVSKQRAAKAKTPQYFPA
jgi:molecular chaperone GrpE